MTASSTLVQKLTFTPSLPYIVFLSLFHDSSQAVWPICCFEVSGVVSSSSAADLACTAGFWADFNNKVIHTLDSMIKSLYKIFITHDSNYVRNCIPYAWQQKKSNDQDLQSRKICFQQTPMHKYHMANSAFHPSGVDKGGPTSAVKVWFTPFVDKHVGVQVKLCDPLTTRLIPERFWAEVH